MSYVESSLNIDMISLLVCSVSTVCLTTNTNEAMLTIIPSIIVTKNSVL